MKTTTPQTPDAVQFPVADAEAFLDLARKDLECLITKLALPYVDDSNPILQLDELRAELWAKVARILQSGKLAFCPTRQKTFGYLKVSLRNHLFSLIQKQVFTSKRNGWIHSRGRTKGRNGAARPRVAQPMRMSLDDPEARLQVGFVDTARQCRELLEDLEYRLLPVERRVLEQLIKEPSAAAGPRESEGSTPGNWRERSHQRLAVAIGLSKNEFARILQRIRAKVLQHPA